MNFVGFSAIQRHVLSLSAGSGGLYDKSAGEASKQMVSGKVVDNRHCVHVTAAVSELSNWITRKSGVQCQTDEVSLTKFLRNCSYDVNKAKRRINRYYDVRRSVDKWFLKEKLDLSDPVVIGILRSGICVPCHLDMLGRPIIICRLERLQDCCSLVEVQLDDVIGLILYVVQHVLKDRQTRTCNSGSSVVAVIDFRHFGMRDVGQLTPKLIKNLVTLGQDSIPCHLKAIHMIDPPTFLPMLVKSLLRSKMRNRVHVHGPKLEYGLHSFVPPYCLPAEYGGNQGNMQQFIDAMELSVKNTHDKVREEDFRLNSPTAVFKIPPDNSEGRPKGHFNVTLHFSSENRVALTDGAGTLYILDTGARHASSSGSLWHVCFSSDKCISSSSSAKPFILLDAVSHSSDAVVECLLLHIDEKRETASATNGEDCYRPFVTVLEWITLESSTTGDGDSTWRIARTRRIAGSSSFDYAALEPNGDSVCIVGEASFAFSYDSKTPVKTFKVEPNGSKQDDVPAYAWTQNSEDVSVWFQFAEAIDKKDVVFQLTSKHLSLGLHNQTTILQGLLFDGVDMESSTWTLADNRKLEVTLRKAKTGVIWTEVVKGDKRGEEFLDKDHIQEIHERLAHLTSDQLNPNPQGNKASSFNTQELEECDTFPVDSYLFVRLDGESHSASHEVNLSSHQWLFSANHTAGEMPALCIRHDVDGLMWQPRMSNAEWTLDHVVTFNALGYVLASKQQKKFVGCSVQDAFVAVADVRRHVYIYHQPESLGSELRNRRTGVSVQTTSKQRVISLDNSDILGLCVSDHNVFVLTNQSLYAVQVVVAQ